MRRRKGCHIYFIIPLVNESLLSYFWNTILIFSIKCIFFIPSLPSLTEFNPIPDVLIKSLYAPSYSCAVISLIFTFFFTCKSDFPVSFIYSNMTGKSCEPFCSAAKRASGFLPYTEIWNPACTHLYNKYRGNIKPEGFCAFRFMPAQFLR